MIDITRLCHANNGMDEQVGLGFARSAEGQLLMRAVEWVARLEGDNLAPAELAKIGAQLVGRVATTAEVVVHGLLDACHGATEVDLACLVVQIVHGGVRIIVCAEHHLGFAGFVRLPAVCDCHCGEDDALLVTQGDILAKF